MTDRRLRRGVRALRAPGFAGARAVAGLHKTGGFFGDAALLDFATGFFAVSDSPDLNPSASRRIMDRFAAMLGTVFPDGRPAADGRAWFDLLEGEASSGPGGALMKALVGALERAGHPPLFYDEVAAAALLDPSSLEHRKAQWRVEGVTAKGLLLQPVEEGGTVSALAFSPDRDALAILRAACAAPAPGAGRKAGMQDAHDEDASVDARLKAFHGHLGPYVVLGWRMGRIALRSLDSEGHFGLRAEVHTVLEPPASCLIDGVQLSSGCTLGKRNIEVEPAEGAAFAVFYCAGGARCEVRLKHDLPARVADLVERLGVEEAGACLLHAPESELFETTTFPGEEDRDHDRARPMPGHDGHGHGVEDQGREARDRGGRGQGDQDAGDGS